MKKSLVALAVAGAFAAPALADVTISGAINAGPMLTSDGDGSISVPANSPFTPGCTSNPCTIDGGNFGSGTGKGFSQSNIANNYSNFNIASVDDIGGGNQVVLNIQTAVGLGETSDVLGNRNSYLGIKGGWGGVYWGTNENIYEQYMYQADPLDGAVGLGGNLSLLGTPGAATVFDVDQGTSDAGFYRRTSNTIWYESPNWGGFSLGAAATLNAKRTIVLGVEANPRVYSFGVQYKPEGGPFYVNVAYERHNDLFGIDAISAAGGSGVTNSTDTKDTGFQVGVGFNLGNFGLGVRFETLDYEANSTAAGDLTAYERDALWLGLKFNLPSGYFGAEVGQAQDANCSRVGLACNGDDTGATLLGIGYFHNLSKQSQFQVIYAHINNGDAANYVFAGGPSRANNVNGASHKGVYVSIKHVF